ncbi:MAG: hypothetical protein IJD28_03215 [Deferribacterales bacterium]|nr:hypothetical protein [Deferribacterales bacterium]
MNYRIIIGGYRFKAYDQCVKLFIHSAGQSDYIVKIEGFSGSTPVSPKRVNITLTGSSKKVYTDILLDFDGIFIDDDAGIILSPEVLGIDAAADAVHYWAIMGSLCKIISDISPAYVTGYLLEKNMKKELEVFTKFASQLPFALQVAVNESMKDIID